MQIFFRHCVAALLFFHFLPGIATARGFPEIAEALANQYRTLESIQLDGSSTTKCPGVPDQVDTYSFASNGSFYQARRHIDSNEFIQTFDGERSQFFSANRKYLEILINRRTAYPIVLPHLMALEWLGDVGDSRFLQCHHLLNDKVWEARFQDCEFVSEGQESLVINFPCRKCEGKSYYRVRFSKGRDYAVDGWELVDEGRVKKALEVKEHLLLPIVQFYLPTSIMLESGGVECRASITNVKVNDQVELKIIDLSPLAEDIYNEFDVRDHVEESRRIEAQLSGPPPERTLGYWLLSCNLIVVFFYLGFRWLRGKRWQTS